MLLREIVPNLPPSTLQTVFRAELKSKERVNSREDFHTGTYMHLNPTVNWLGVKKPTQPGNGITPLVSLKVSQKAKELLLVVLN